MKGLFLFSNGMEDSEGLSTLALLRRAKVDIVSATFEQNKKVTTSYQQVIFTDFHMDDVNLDDFDFLVIPGGPYVGNVIHDDIQIKKTIKAFYDRDKIIGAICAAPRFLGQLGILDGKKYTCFPGSEIDIPKGTYLKYEKAVTDGNIITGRSAGAVVEFSYHLVSKIKDEKTAKWLVENIIY